MCAGGRGLGEDPARGREEREGPHGAVCPGPAASLEEPCAHEAEKRVIVGWRGLQVTFVPLVGLQPQSPRRLKWPPDARLSAHSNHPTLCGIS